MNKEIQNTVESLFGEDVKIVDCETSSSTQQEEILLINGVPINLEGLPTGDAHAIKNALLLGQVPAVEHLNLLLFRAGLAHQKIEIETTLTVKSSLTTTEEIMVSRNGRLLDEQTIQTKEQFNHQSQQKEIWQPNNEQRESVNKLCKKGNAIQSADNNQSIKSKNASHSIRDFKNNRENNSTTSASFSLISSSAVNDGSDQVLRSNSNTSTVTTTGDYSVKSSNLSNSNSGCDDSLSITTTSAKNQNLSISNFAGKMTRVSTKLPLLSTSGTLDLFIDMLLPVHQLKKIDVESTQFQFILCIRLFIPPHKLLARIIEIYHSQWSQTAAHRFLQLLKLWLQTCPNDFRDNSFMQEVRVFTQICQKYDYNLEQDVGQLLRHIPHKLAQLDEEYCEWNQLVKDTKNPLSSLGQQNKNKSSKLERLSLMCITGFKELSHQLTVIEHSYLTLIHPDEILEILQSEQFNSRLWGNANNLSQQSCTQRRSSIEAYKEWFDRLSCIPATQIVKLKKKSSVRVHAIDFWIETALECFNIGNFNSLMAILSSLNLTAVLRLKKTWSKVRKTKFEVLKHQMDPSSNFSTYRSSMKAAIWRSERENASKHERSVIPYFLLFLKDFLDINKIYRLSIEEINFEKCRHLGNELRNFSEWKHAKCPYEKNTNTVSHLLSTEVFNEAQLLRASYACEPPYSSKEKDDYKTLKDELRSCQSSD